MARTWTLILAQPDGTLDPLAYSEQPMQNRFLVINELKGMDTEMITYLIRSLLSEGCIKYEVVEKTKDGMRPRLSIRHHDRPMWPVWARGALTYGFHPM